MKNREKNNEKKAALDIKIRICNVANKNFKAYNFLIFLNNLK